VLPLKLPSTISLSSKTHNHLLTSYENLLPKTDSDLFALQYRPGLASSELQTICRRYEIDNDQSGSRVRLQRLIAVSALCFAASGYIGNSDGSIWLGTVELCLLNGDIDEGKLYV
jgi:hypothetical protein